MALRLKLISSTKVPICVQGILPETTIGRSTAKIACLEIWHGNRSVELGQLFEVSKSGTSDELCWEGDLKSVHWIGAGMTAGNMVIDGNVGRHLGSQMRGGSIRVAGNVSDFVGCEMQRGSIRIQGNAGDWVGAAYPGTKSGMNRGTIVVTGNAGRGVGFAMRRGLICIGGETQRLAGWNMLGGTIVIGGQAGVMTGKGMVRGTIILKSTNHAAVNCSSLPPTFSNGGQFQSVYLRALARWLDQQQLPIKLPVDSHFRLFHGDHLKGGRGEILIADATN